MLKQLRMLKGQACSTCVDFDNEPMSIEESIGSKAWLHRFYTQSTLGLC